MRLVIIVDVVEDNPTVDPLMVAREVCDSEFIWSDVQCAAWLTGHSSQLHTEVQTLILRPVDVSESHPADFTSVMDVRGIRA